MIENSLIHKYIHTYVQLEGHSSSSCYTQFEFHDMHCSNCSQTLLQCFNDAVMTIRQENFHFSCLTKVITTSSKHCNKFCEQFEQLMSEYRAGYIHTYIHTYIHKFMITIYTYLRVTGHKDKNQIVSGCAKQ